MKAKVRQFIAENTDKGGYTPLSHPVKVTKIAHARRLLSKLIYDLQTGKISGQLAKDLCYLLITFISLLKDTEMMKRIEKLEKIAVRKNKTESATL